MASSREDVDLFLTLTDPKLARYYIRSFDWNVPLDMTPTSITLETGRVVSFSNLSDDDAVAVAMQLVRSIAIPRAEMERNLIQFEN